MANFFDLIGQALYEDVIGRKETHLEEFTLLNAWKFLIESAMEDHKVAMGALRVTRKGDRYEIMQLMLNKNMDPIKKSGEFVFGRTVYAYTLDEDLIDFLGEKDMRVMKLENLKLNK